jgi:colanic acid biosynthesis glycosyl transferase WcaI
VKLLLLSLNFAPEVTGIGRYSGELAAWLADRGHEVTVIAGLPHYPEWRVAADYRGASWRREWHSGIEVLRVPHTVPPPGKVTALRRILMESTFTLSSLRWWLPLLLRRTRFDAVIAVCPPLQNAVLPGWYGLLRRVPWILHIQDFQVDAAVRLGMLRIGVLGRLLYRLENFCLRRASWVATITPAMCRRAIAKGADPHQVLYLPNWADIEHIVPMAPDPEYRRILGAGPDQILVMYAGAMATKQGLEVVLEAAARLHGDNRFRFALVGDGSDGPRLRERAAVLGLDNLAWLPPQPLERLPALLSAADIHLVVQKRDAADLVMPSKLANILAAGRPAIATAEAGTALWDVLEEGGAGRCVPPESAGELVAGLRALADDAGLRARMAERARRHAEQHLARDAILEGFERQLEALIAGEYPLREAAK